MEYKSDNQKFFGFTQYTHINSQPGFCLVVIVEGETELWAWDGTPLGIQEIKRYYNVIHGRKPELITAYKQQLIVI